MTVNLFTLGFVSGCVVGYVKHNGHAMLKNEFQGAEYSVNKKGSSLDTIVQTANLGEFDIKMVFDNRGRLDLDEVNYKANIFFLSIMDIYKKSNAIIPAASTSPFSYKIIVKNKDVNARIFVNYGALNGSAQLDMGPDSSGVYQMKQVTFYDSSGRPAYGFVPPARKPKPSGSIVIPSVIGTSTGKTSP